METGFLAILVSPLNLFKSRKDTRYESHTEDPAMVTTPQVSIGAGHVYKIDG